MGTAFAVLFSLIPAILCDGQTPAVSYYEALPSSIAIYDNGYLFSWDFPKYNWITLYGRDTKPVYSVPERGENMFSLSWTVDSDGEAVRVYESQRPAEGGIELLDAGGKPALMIKTGSYRPQHVIFAPDHTIWTIGYSAEALKEGSEIDFNLLHHYARTGEELGQALPRSQIATDENPYAAVQAIIGGRRLYVANDRLGFIAQLHDDHETWIEVSSAGVLLGEYDLGHFPELSYVPAAMTADGRTYASIWKDSRLDGWAVLDDSTHAWRKLAGYPKGWIIGSDGNNLVFSKEVGAWTVVQFVPSGSLRLAKVQEEDAAAGAQR